MVFQQKGDFVAAATATTILRWSDVQSESPQLPPPLEELGAEVAQDHAHSEVLKGATKSTKG